VGDSTQERHVIISSWFNCALTQIIVSKLTLMGLWVLLSSRGSPLLACVTSRTCVLTGKSHKLAAYKQPGYPVRLAVSTSWWVQVGWLKYPWGESKVQVLSWKVTLQLEQVYHLKLSTFWSAA